MKKVIVTAHPDDETLWAGGLAAQGGFDIICCSIPRHDPIRAWKFYNACKVLGARGRILPFTEGEPGMPLKGLELLNLNGYDAIWTHNSEGEYGHPHHRQVHKYIVGNYGYKKIFTFVYGSNVTGQTLLPSILKKKIDALRCYDHCLPYEGRNIPKWQALLLRYKEHDLTRESFNEYTA